MDVEKYVLEGRLRKIKPAEDLVAKEFREAAYDFSRAKKAFDEEDFKWATVKAYYSMFHAAKAVLFKIGLQEKSHYVISEVLEELSKDGKLESSFVDDFRAAMAARMEADYHYEYSEKSAEQIIEIAKEFLARMKKLAQATK
ncbi:MAG: HEPN domain-containing protein [Candidatus Micrarchaeota archaeon]